MTKGAGVAKKKQPRTKKAVEPGPFVVRDGGDAALHVPFHTERVRVTDRTTGAVIDPSAYVMNDGGSVRKSAGVWARGRGRWLVEPEQGGDGGEG